MNDFQKILWGFLFSTGGTILGWTLNQLNQWISIRKDDQKQLRKVIYSLLETYNTLNRSNYKPIVLAVTNKVMTKVDVNQNDKEQTRIQLTNYYNNILGEILKKELAVKLQELEPTFLSNLKDLSAIDPIQAYYLNGKTKFFETFNPINSMLDELKIQAKENTDQEITINNNDIINIFEDDYLSETLDDLENSLKVLSKKVGYFFLWEIHKLLNHMKKDNIKEREEKIDEMFKQLEPLLHQFGSSQDHG